MPKPNTAKSVRQSNRAAQVPGWELAPVADLKPAARRTRSHPKYKRQTLERSIAEQGLLDPITINATGVIVDGHLRYDIAVSLGWTTIPAIRIEHLGEAELRAYALAANKWPAVSNYDVEALRLELEEIEAEVPTLDLTLTGFTIGEIDRVRGNYQAGLYDDLDEDKLAPTHGKPKARLGDLYELGSHRLLCGDALNLECYAKLMGDDRAQICFTDSPYNCKINGHVSGSGAHAEFAMASGEMSVDGFTAFLTTALANIREVMLDGALAYCCMDHAHIGELIAAGDTVFDERLNICVWDKGRGGMGALYRSQHKLVAVFKHGTVPHINNVSLGKNGRNRTNVWSFPGMAGFGRARKKALELHPTVKPVALIAEALLDVSGPGDIVLDPFGGSGSTLIAAERLGRHARLIELDPVYVDRICERWTRFTNTKPKLLNRSGEEDT